MTYILCVAGYFAIGSFSAGLAAALTDDQHLAAFWFLVWPATIIVSLGYVIGKKLVKS